MAEQPIERIQAKAVPRPGTWIAAAVVGVAAALLVYSLFTNENYRWDVVASYLFDPRVLSGVM